MAALRAVVEVLATGESLAARHRDHALKGEWSGTRDCHVGNDWLLLYRLADGVLYLVRLGSHAELFD